jgi:Spx/MgsR family transcriptional regulator
MVEMYGIPNCDTIKKSRRWLEDRGVEYSFHDYKKEGVNPELLQSWCEKRGWETLLNRRGTTWRKLPDSDKEGIDESRALALMVANPSMIKRPVLMTENDITVGFSVDVYQELFG